MGRAAADRADWHLGHIASGGPQRNPAHTATNDPARHPAHTAADDPARHPAHIATGHLERHPAHIATNHPAPHPAHTPTNHPTPHPRHTPPRRPSSATRRLPAALLAAALTLGPALPAHAATPLPPGGGCLPAPQGTAPDIPWPQRQLAPQRVWDLTKGQGITVAVVDTGVDAHTPQLAGRVLPGADVAGSGPADDDCYGHGTFVAGIIAAAPAPGTGFTGVAPEATILPIRVTSPADSTLTSTALANGIRRAVDAGARVINVSASTSVPDAGLAAAVQYAEAHDVVVVASAANGAQEGDPVTYPASYPTVLAVGAVDSTGQHADFSQTGPYLALVAPGVDVVSVGPRGPGQWQGSGTSYAAPFVAGTAALVRSYHPQLSAAQVRHRLEVTANHPAAALPDPALGWGTVNPQAAVTAVLPEEGAAGATVVAPPPARAAAAPVRDEVGPVLAILGVLALVVLIPGAVMVSRLSAAGRRRGWRPARTAERRP
ncbi:type VII secretion-associated serine protease mycosin [Amycolatopsis sacchari]|uniref:type VII secretion-associated serine protease mycosin n=1 Tax=Amycolatopsis sacchari TaxID=115433 RepID=UPI003D715AFB